MDVFVLDSQLRRIKLYDLYFSLIWTERFYVNGDFQLVLLSNQDTRSTFLTNVLLAMSESKYVGVVETVESDVDDQGNYLLKVTGRFLEGVVLNQRVAMGALTDLTTTPQWVISDQPADVMRTIFHDICVEGLLDTGDIIPFINEGVCPGVAASTIEEPVDSITAAFDPNTVYFDLNAIGSAWLLGFRILRDEDNSALYFDVYAGNDRTTQQSTFPAVVFSPDLDNLENTSELTSVANYYNVAYVFSPAGYETVYATDVDDTVAGFKRNVMFINATDITSDNPDVTAALIQRGSDALLAQRQFYAFDGEINQNSQYKYGIDYFLGDLVVQRNVDGIMNFMRVTEQIFSSDNTGARSYPTLTLNITIDTGSWLSWDGDEDWSDVDPDTDWSDLPD